MTDIVCYWNRDHKIWIVYAADAQGNQLWDAEFFANRRTLRDDWGRFTNVWGKK